MHKAFAVLLLTGSIAAAASSAVFGQGLTGTEGADLTRHAVPAAHTAAFTGMEGGAGAEHDNPWTMHTDPDYEAPGR
jgi:hypothetical protein